MKRYRVVTHNGNIYVQEEFKSIYSPKETWKNVEIDVWVGWHLTHEDLTFRTVWGAKRWIKKTVEAAAALAADPVVKWGPYP